MQLWQRRILGILALGGSVVGLGVGSTGLLLATGPVVGKLLSLPFLGLYCWGIWCGLRLLEGAESAYRLNRLFWALQIPYLTSPYVGYFFASGAYLFITFNLSDTRMGFQAYMGSQFGYSLLQSEKPLVIGINVFALAIFFYFTRLLRNPPSNIAFEKDAPKAARPSI
jgi:hypothetical protein